MNNLNRLKSYKYFKDSYNKKTHIKTILLFLFVVVESVFYVGYKIIDEIFTEAKKNAEYNRRRNEELRIISENSYAANRGAAVAFNRVDRAFARQDARNRDIDRQERQHARTFYNIANGRDNFMGGRKRW